ncbi:hypothetical protein [Streptosporangium sp. NPDC051022]|uniref:hypothetical protein n=1 Tax=Streptosporangium sp. NPDC051022 TaxID=3155752 RepID=UPI00341EDCF5
MPLSVMSGRVVARIGGVACLVSGGLHIAASATAPHTAAASLALAVMAVLCLGCGAHLLRHDGRAAWAMALAVNAGMVAFHTLVPVTGETHEHAGHMGASTPADAVMSWGTTIAAAEAVLACAVLVALTVRAAPGHRPGEPAGEPGDLSRSLAGPHPKTSTPSTRRYDT